MKIFSRYILSEVVQHAAIGVSLFTFVIFMRDLGRLLEIVVRNSAPLPSVAELFLLTLPVACTITIPMGLLVGILIGLSRLAADSEVTAMRASGLGAWMFVRIIAIFAVATWLLALANSIWLAPMSSAALVPTGEQAPELRRPPLKFSRGSSTKTSRTWCSTSKMCAPVPTLPSGAASSWPMSPILPPPRSRWRETVSSPPTIPTRSTCT